MADVPTQPVLFYGDCIRYVITVIGIPPSIALLATLATNHKNPKLKSAFFTLLAFMNAQDVTSMAFSTTFDVWYKYCNGWQVNKRTLNIYVFLQ